MHRRLDLQKAGGGCASQKRTCTRSSRSISPLRSAGGGESVQRVPAAACASRLALQESPIFMLECTDHIPTIWFSRWGEAPVVCFGLEFFWGFCLGAARA